MKKLIYYLLSISLLVSFTSCQKEQEREKKLTLASADSKVSITDNGSKATFTTGPAGTVVYFTVSTSAAWTASADTQGWCVTEKANDKLAIMIDEYIGGTADRVTTVTVENEDELSATIVITQSSKEKATVTLTGDSNIIPSKGGTIEVAVETNQDNVGVEITDAFVPWVTAALSSDKKTVTLTADRNFLGEMLSATLVVTVGEGINKAAAEWKVTQRDGAMIFEYTVTEEGTTIALPVVGEVDITIDWGDGTESEYFRTAVNDDGTGSSLLTHWYESTGVFKVSVTGTAEGIASNGVDKVVNYLTDIIQWGDMKLTSMKGAFKGASFEAVSMPDDGEIFAEVTTFEEAFSGCASLTTVPVGFFDSNLKAVDFTNCFNGCVLLEGESPYSVIDGAKAHLYERGRYPEIFTEPTASTGAFSGCDKLSDYANIPDTWK